MQRLWITLVVVGVLGCFLFEPEPPRCNIDPRHTDGRIGSAGCMVPVEGQLLVVRTRKNGKLGFPAGYAERGETAQCTAHRETWEESGTVVRVGKLLRTFPNGFHLYACDLVEETSPGSESLPVPRRARHEITEISLRHPAMISRNDWRYPDQLPTVVKLFESIAPVEASSSS